MIYNRFIEWEITMALAYTKEFLINVFLHRFRNLDEIKLRDLRSMADSFFDAAGRDKFRVYGCVTPEAVREYKAYQTGK